MEKKTETVTTRFTAGQMEYVARVAETMTLPTDSSPNRSRALQAMVTFLMTNFGLTWLTAQRKQCGTLYTGEAATA